MKNIFIIGSRGYNYNYGGWETFVTELVNNSDKDTKFFIPYLTHDRSHNKRITKTKNLEQVELFNMRISFVTMFTFTIKSIMYYIRYIRKNKIKNSVMLILGSKIGPLMPLFYTQLKRRGCKVVMNPDGIEWKRDKWVWWIKICFKISERFHVRFADHIVCDSKEIKKYIDKEYKANKKTSFIAYGTHLDNKIDEKRCKKYFKDNNIKENDYYIYVGRFIPENNLETIIKEYMKSNTTKKLYLITNYEKNRYYNKLKKQTNFEQDDRIVFLGPIYDRELLTYIRLNAFGYIHGHSAGGTNPSLLEALGHTKVNILFDVAYNKEVGGSSCLYFSKVSNSLSRQINIADNFTKKEIDNLGKECIKRIEEYYTWPLIVDEYNKVFDGLLGD